MVGVRDSTPLSMYLQWPMHTESKYPRWKVDYGVFTYPTRVFPRGISNAGEGNFIRR